MRRISLLAAAAAATAAAVKVDEVEVCGHLEY